MKLTVSVVFISFGIAAGCYFTASELRLFRTDIKQAQLPQPYALHRGYSGVVYDSLAHFLGTDSAEKGTSLHATRIRISASSATGRQILGKQFWQELASTYPEDVVRFDSKEFCIWVSGFISPAHPNAIYIPTPVLALILRS